CSWSPPVPAMSMASGLIVKVSADAIIASMKPVISSAVSPFAVSAVRKLAIRRPSTCPSRIACSASRALARSRFVPCTSGLSTSAENDSITSSSPARKWHSDKLVANLVFGYHHYHLKMTPTYLDDIVEHHRERARRDERVWQDRLENVRYEGPSMLDALKDASLPLVKVIAEVKRRSPSKGWLNEHLDAAQLARDYEAGGASAISVLTDGPHFAGSADDFAHVRSATQLPLLRKDFTISANDVLDAAAMGASCVLLIVAALSDEELGLFLSVAHQCGLDALVEVHDRDEAGRAVSLGAALIGVNQRDLRSFEV